MRASQRWPTSVTQTENGQACKPFPGDTDQQHTRDVQKAQHLPTADNYQQNAHTSRDVPCDDALHDAAPKLIHNDELCADKMLT